MRFEDKNKEIVLKPTVNINEKVQLVENLYNKAGERIEHYDKLRQQHLNYALLAFSGLVAFTIRTEDARMQYVGCLGIMALMLIFCLLDHKLRRLSYGLRSSMLIFTQVNAYLLDNPKEEVVFLQYHKDGEKKAKWWKSQHMRIYLSLIMASGILGFMIYFGG